MIHPALSRLIRAGDYEIFVSQDSEKTAGYWVEIFAQSKKGDRSLRQVFVPGLVLCEGESEATSALSWINAQGRGRIHIHSNELFLAIHCEGFVTATGAVVGFAEKGMAEKKSIPENAVDAGVSAKKKNTAPKTSAPKTKASKISAPKITAAFWLRLYASTLEDVSLETLVKIAGMSRSTVHKFIKDELAAENILRKQRTEESSDPHPKARLYKISQAGGQAWLKDTACIWPLYRNKNLWPKRHQAPIAVYQTERLEQAVFHEPQYPVPAHLVTKQEAWWETGAHVLAQAGMLRLNGAHDLYFTESAWNKFTAAGMIRLRNDQEPGKATRCTIIRDDAHIVRLMSAMKNAVWHLADELVVQAGDDVSNGEQVAGTNADTDTGTNIDTDIETTACADMPKIPAIPGHIPALYILDASNNVDARVANAAQHAWVDFINAYGH